MKELFKSYYKKAEEIMNKMSLEEKVGQMFLARYPQEKVNEQIISENPGGYILFGRDFDEQTKASITRQLAQNQFYSRIKMFLVVDEEGGTVCRVSSHKALREERFKSPQELFKEGGLERILNDSKEKSTLLKEIGINVNLAPVVDIPTNINSFMYKRSFGLDAKGTSEFAKFLVAKMISSNMISCMKHFPGYGDNVDTHTGIAIDTRDYEEFERKDFEPFKKGIEVGAPMILVNHNVINCMDKVYHASLSPSVHETLRKVLKFSGLIVTDDLKMSAVKGYAENGNAAKQAVLSGNDIIISSNFVEQKREVLEAINLGEIPEDYINIAVRRILSCKYSYGIIE